MCVYICNVHTPSQEEILLLAHQFYASVILSDDRAQLGEEEMPTTFMVTQYHYGMTLAVTSLLFSRIV